MIVIERCGTSAQMNILVQWCLLACFYNAISKIDSWKICSDSHTYEDVKKIIDWRMNIYWTMRFS